MNFKQAAIISTFLSKDYAEQLFQLLVAYRDISASEAASRLGLHIRTVQDFLDTMAEFNLVEKKEVYERKRPYYRYTLIKRKIEITIDLDEEIGTQNEVTSEFKIRESGSSGAKYGLARNGEYFSTVTLWMGEGRAAKERKISLTVAQGKFLYYLPFPDGAPLPVDDIMKRAEISTMHKSEIMDIVQELQKFRVIEKTN